MTAPKQIWNENLPSGDQNSRSYPSDEDTITFDRTQSGGTAQQGLLAKPQTESGEWELAGAGEKPGGVIKGSGGKGRVSILLRGYEIGVPRGDSTPDTAVTVVNAQNLSGANLTITNNLEEGQDPSPLTVTPTSPTLSDTSVPATITIRGTNVDDVEIEETLSFADSVKAVAQTTDATFQTVTEVTTTGWSAGTVTIATENIETITPGDTVVGDTKTIGSETHKGYAKGAATGGIGRITRVTPDTIYFNLP